MARMTNSDYSTFRDSVEDIFTTLYVIDVGSLQSDQRKTHQEALAAAYLAVIRIENASFSALADSAKEKLAELSIATTELQRKLAGLKKARETLQLASEALGVLTSITKLLKVA
jgi:hypothetical protein